MGSGGGGWEGFLGSCLPPAPSRLGLTGRGSRGLPSAPAQRPLPVGLSLVHFSLGMELWGLQCTPQNPQAKQCPGYIRRGQERSAEKGDGMLPACFCFN